MPRPAGLRGALTSQGSGSPLATAELAPAQTRKDVAQVFCGLLRVSVDGRLPCVAFLSAHKELLDTLTHGCAAAAAPPPSRAVAANTRAPSPPPRSYERADTALITGSMLREAVKVESLCQCAPAQAPAPRPPSRHPPLFGPHAAPPRYLLESPSMFEVLAYTDVSTFEVASDAFLTFKELLTRHPALTSAFLLAHSQPFFDAYNSKLLASQNYVTRRQSIKARPDTRGARLSSALTRPPYTAAGRGVDERGQRGGHDAVHRQRAAPDAGDEPAARPLPLHPV